jgi:hypothetical protein
MPFAWVANYTRDGKARRSAIAPPLFDAKKIVSDYRTADRNGTAPDCPLMQSALRRIAAFIDANERHHASTVHPPYSYRLTAAIVLAGTLLGVAIAAFAGATLASSLGALVVVYAGGYLVGCAARRTS